VANELIALGGAFLAAGLLARIGRRVGLPTIPFFIVAGILTGPNTPGLVLVEDPRDLEVFAAVELVLLLFHLGLEFSLADLLGGGRRLVFAGAAYIVLNIGGGLLFGLYLGWGVPEAFVIAGALGISSSAIATKLLVELKRLANPETGLILGIIVVEDVFLALYLAALQPILGASDSLADALGLFGRAFGFLLVLFAVARYAASWVGRLISSSDDELLTVLFVGLAIFVAGMSEELGVSDAIGAFMVGLILAETVLKHRIEKLVLPLRDAFAAVFFFAFGLTIDPADIRMVAGPVAMAVGMSVLLNIIAGAVTARGYGFGRREAANVGLTVLGRGEFSLILATLAATAGLDERIGPFVALYVLSLAILGPLMASRSPILAAWLPAGAFKPQTGRAPPSRKETKPSAPGNGYRLGDSVAFAGLAQGIHRSRSRGSALILQLRERGPGRLLLPLGLVMAAVAYGVAGYMTMGSSFVQALSIVLAVLTPSDPPAEVTAVTNPYFSLSVTAFGFIALLTLLITSTTVAIEGGFGFSSRRRRMQERMERLKDHYIICAYGRVGRATAQELQAEGIPFVVVDTKEELEQQMIADGMVYIIGDPTSEPILRQAGIETARGIVCAVDSDATNVYITLTARSMNPDIYIVARASGSESPERLQRAGANRVISPYRSSGRQMALLVLHPRVVDRLEVLGRRLEELAVEAGSPLIGQNVREVCGAAEPLLVYRATGQTVTNPGHEVMVEAGDRIFAWGAAADLRPMEGDT
jgi:monovalent cation:H+ antiporter-2, CPA2 family